MFAARTFKGKRVAVFGLARSGLACIAALKSGGAEVLAWDDSEPAVAKGRDQGLPIVELRTVDFATVDGLVLSPGVPLTHPTPHWTVAKARAAGVEIIGDTEVFQREIARTGARLVAITGTNGKSTTTALTGHLFKAAGRDCETGGNIGTAVLSLKPPVKDRVYVVELSSFQIDLMPSLKPDAGVLTNITPDHLDRHGTMENYAAVKARMFAKQGKGDRALIGVDDEWCAAIAANLQGEMEKVPVSVVRALEDGISAPNGILRHRQGGREIAQIDLRAMPALKGVHNWQNAAMAYGAAHALGLSTEEIAAGMKSFPGLVHRMQEIGRIGPIAFINDSKATNADAAAKALASFDTIYWIAGGIAKTGGITTLAEYFPRVVKAYLIGQAADEFAKTLAGKAEIEMCGTLDRAVEAAARDVQGDKKPGAVVLLSPACASFDHYPNFEVRGDAFVRAVSGLAGVTMAQVEAMMLINRSDRGLLASWWFTVDKLLLSAVLLLMALGVLISMAASPPVAERIGADSFHFFRNQLMFLLPAALVLVATSMLDPRQARRASFWTLIVSLALMVAALKFGPEIKGAHRWINIGPINLQPSEFAKPAFVAIAAWLLAERTKQPDVPGHLLAFGLAGIFLGLLIIQPDFGQTVLVTTTFAAMLLIYGISWIYVGGLASLGVAGILVAYETIPHVASRIDRFLNPEKGDTFQVDTATQAFKNGGIMGTGPGGGEAKQILPDAHSDFTFAVVGEEFGLIACLALVVLFCFIVMRVLRRASTEADPFPALAMSGLVTVFGLQAAINMGVNVSLLPAKGMTLPFISYGGSSLIGMAFAMGLILAFGRGRPKVRIPTGDWQLAKA